MSRCPTHANVIVGRHLGVGIGPILPHPTGPDGSLCLGLGATTPCLSADPNMANNSHPTPTLALSHINLIPEGHLQVIWNLRLTLIPHGSDPCLNVAHGSSPGAGAAGQERDGKHSTHW